MILAAFLASIVTMTDWPVTRAEETLYKETSTHAQVLAFLNELQTVTSVRVQTIGHTDGGRPIPMAIASNPPIADAREARRLGRPIVYIQANIHGGEVEGKEAALIVLRDLYREDSDLLKKLVLLIVPNYNPDGNERWGDGRVKRRSQTGPDVIGDRTNGKDLDLNRDCMKAESPEMRAVLEHVYNAWDPDVVFDLHTTDGTRHGYGLTYSTPLHPNTHPGFLDYARGEFISRVRARLRSVGLETFDYGNTGPVDGTTAWSTFGYEGRYVTNYSGLRGRMTILSEAMSYSPFDERVRDTIRFVRTCLDEIAKDAAKILGLSKSANEDLKNWSSNGKELGVRFKLASRGTEDVLLEKAPTEGERDRYGKITEISIARMPIYDRFQATRTAKMPAAYIVPASESRVIDLLLLQGVTVERFVLPWSGKVSTFRISEAHEASQAFQGHKLVRLEGAFSDSHAEVPVGDFLVRCSQPLGVLVFELLEPEALDGACAWGFTSLPAIGTDFPFLKVGNASGAVTELVGKRQ